MTKKYIFNDPFLVFRFVMLTSLNQISMEIR